MIPANRLKKIRANSEAVRNHLSHGAFPMRPPDPDRGSFVIGIESS
jgi:hypothetical protein